MPYNYTISKRASNKINSFYRNVAKKYKHTYSFEQMCNNLREAYSVVYQIENGLLRRNPTIKRWEGKGFMANTKKWYYLYQIEGDTIYVLDACHSQNMHESIAGTKHIRLSVNQLHSIITETIKKILLPV